METGTFWAYQEVIDVLYSIGALGLLLLIPLLGLFPTFYSFLFRQASTTRRAEDFEILLRRFLTPRIFSIVVLLLNALFGGGLVLILLLKYNYLPWTISWAEASVVSLSASIVVLLVIAWRRMTLSIWSKIFSTKQDSLLLLRNNGLLAYTRALTQLGLFSISFLPLENNVFLWILIVSFSLFILLRVIICIRRLSHNLSSIFHIFLYLCTAELLPLAYVLIGVQQVHQHNYLVLLFEYL